LQGAQHMAHRLHAARGKPGCGLPHPAKMCLPSVHPPPRNVVANSIPFTWFYTASVRKLYCPGKDCSRGCITSVDLGRRRRLFTHSGRPPKDGNREANLLHKWIRRHTS